MSHVHPHSSLKWLAQYVKYTAPTEFMRRSLSTHSASRLLRMLDNTTTRLVSARGIRFVADGMAHLDATTLLQSKTPSQILDSGLRDALGRHAGTLQNLASIESSKSIRVAGYASHSQGPHHTSQGPQHTHLFTAYFVI